uniref:Helicase SMUBP-2/HCS1 1B domain-containing protein n=1 Tax=Rhizophora mucronata TaxID=61149 RepID=A0A2P2LEK6_RHIMU
MEGEKTKNKKKASPLSLQQFVSIVSPLIDLEKEAEITASISSGASRSLDSAQKRGSTILNLKCVDAQTGLMGKTLLEFQSNKGDVLPAHKVNSPREHFNFCFIIIFYFLGTTHYPISAQRKGLFEF